MDDHAQILDLIPAYALECLDEAEARQVAAHLEVCPPCASEYRAYREAAGLLPQALPLETPPAGLRRRILQAAAQRVPSAAAPARPAWRALFDNLLGSWGLATRLGALALIVVLGVSNLLLWQRLSSPGEFRIVTLAAGEAIPSATGILVINGNSEHGTLVVDGLEALPAEQQYQLWLIRDGARTSGGVFSVDPDGYGSVWIDSPRPLGEYQSFGVTIEPAGGSPGPTGERVLRGDL